MRTTPSIDIYCFNKYFKLFLKLVESESHSKFISFSSNEYTDNQEGYKDEIYRQARERLNFWNWKEEDIGKGDIIKRVISAIEVEDNNLVDWRLKEKFKKDIPFNDPSNYEEVFFDLFHNLKEEEEIFDTLTNLFGRKYPLVSYFFFLKDRTKYMPISPDYFDKAFEKLCVKNFKTSHKCSWSNYLMYNNLLKQIKELLIEEGVKDVTLLNAHSFAWIISSIEEDLKELGINNEEDLKEYKKLDSKDKERVIKARIGQGYFRDQLINYWNGKCCVTKCSETNILIASHIKPWKDCNNEEAIDVHNGLLLTPNLDKLFDQGLISFSNDRSILISKQITDDNLKLLCINKEMRISHLDKKHVKYLKITEVEYSNRKPLDKALRKIFKVKEIS